MKYIKLRNSKKLVKVDNRDYKILNKFIWRATTYKDHTKVTSTHYGSLVIMSRIILNVTNTKLLVDHINGDTLDNRRQNLRIVNSFQNSMNRSKIKRTCTSKHKGIYFYKSRNVWLSRITIKGKTKCLGYFKKEKDAAKAYNIAAIKYFGQYAKLNEV